MTETTPGPWCFEAENGRAHPRVYGADNSLVAEVGNANLMRWEVWDHDARLIAAAPPMLAVLEMCRHVLKDRDQSEQEMKVYNAVRAVIHLATESRP